MWFIVKISSKEGGVYRIALLIKKPFHKNNDAPYIQLQL
ncbi:hypothetical protein HNR44_002347 [Geomicrobium halophilum]|uniref:Uncharacterized protein n=1 Tax=Geomicrobium halophilum TaxID=549000 RepID=A0A841PRC6_9BACL|nr:hypothetical protein [Geomicrobium halophilum]